MTDSTPRVGPQGQTKPRLRKRFPVTINVKGYDAKMEYATREDPGKETIDPIMAETTRKSFLKQAARLRDFQASLHDEWVDAGSPDPDSDEAWAP